MGSEVCNVPIPLSAGSLNRQPFAKKFPMCWLYSLFLLPPREGLRFTTTGYKKIQMTLDLSCSLSVHLPLLLPPPSLSLLLLFLLSSSPQSFTPDGWRVGSGLAAPEAVSPGSAQQVAADPAVLCHTSRPGMCVYFSLWSEMLVEPICRGNRQQEDACVTQTAYAHNVLGCRLYIM